MLRLRLLALAAAVLLCAPAQAQAQRSPGLAQLPGPAGCLAAHRIPGCGRAPGLGGAHSVVATPTTVFVAGRTAITALRRDPATGALAYAGSTPHGVAGGGVFLALSPDGAFLYATSEIGTAWYPASGPLRELGSVSAYGGVSIAVGPDGLHAYTAGAAGVRVFARDPATGALTPQSCARDCARSGELANLFQLAIAPDGHSLYALSMDAVVTFAVGADGNLAERGCRGSLEPCRRTAHLDDLSDVQISPDGRTVAIAANGFLVTFARGSDGALAPARCAYATDTPSHRTLDGCRPATFDAADALAYTPDGRLVVGGERNVGAVTGDRLTPLACLNDRDDGLDRRCRLARGIEFPLGLAAEGGNVYVATGQGTVATLVAGQR